MNYSETVLDLIGRTPLVKLQRLVDPATMATVLVKMEQLNPGRVGQGPDGLRT